MNVNLQFASFSARFVQTLRKFEVAVRKEDKKRKVFFTNKLTINLKTKFESRLNFLPSHAKVGHINKDNAYLAYRLTVSFLNKTTK